MLCHSAVCYPEDQALEHMTNQVAHLATQLCKMAKTGKQAKKFWAPEATKVGVLKSSCPLLKRMGSWDPDLEFPIWKWE